MTQIKPTRRGGFNGVQIVDVHVNVDQEIIQITEDKLRLILKDHLHSLTHKGGWIAPFGLLVSIVTTFCTAKFDTFIGLGSDFWRALFTLVAVVSVFWLVVAIKRGREVLTLDELINKVKNKS